MAAPGITDGAGLQAEVHNVYFNQDFATSFLNGGGRPGKFGHVQ